MHDGKYENWLKCRESMAYLKEVAVAIGWLARENKISLREKDNMLFAKIDDVEFSFG